MNSSVADQAAANGHSTSGPLEGHQNQALTEELSAIVASIREDLTHCEQAAQDFVSFEDFKSWWKTFYHYEIQDLDLSEQEIERLDEQLKAAFEVLTGRCNM